MARSVAIKQAQGNQARSCMVKFDMDGNDTVPLNWNLGITVVTEFDDGTDVDASAAISVNTGVAAISNKAAIQALVDELNTTLTGAKAFYAQNSAYEYIVHVQPLDDVAWLATISTPVFAVGI